MKVLIGLVLYVFTLSYIFGIGVNLTPSLPIGLYIRDNSSIHKGDIVRFCLDKKRADIVNASKYIGNGSCENGLKPLLKIVAGVSGDKVEMSEDKKKIILNDWSVSLPKKYNSKNEEIQTKEFFGIIPKDKIYLLTSHEGSFDSRYYGLIDIHSVQKMETFFVF